MKVILDRISTEIEYRRMSKRKIAKNIKIAHSTISNFLTGKDEMKFNAYGEFIREIYPNEKQILIRRELYIEYFSKTSRPINKRIGMDYLAVHGEMELLKLLINQEINSDDEINKEWAQIYKLLYLRNTEELKGSTFANLLYETEKDIKLKTNEMKILFKIIEMFTEYDQSNFKVMTDKASFLIDELKEIKNSYIRLSFECKVRECILQGLLLSDEIEKTRQLCHEIIANNELKRKFPMIVATAYGVLGESYTFTNFEKARFFIEEAVKILEKGLNEKMKMRHHMMLD
ncbi:AimR family lysis-lysogeny pheromone receptor, partial [Bacillus sp. JJ1127]|uniref:AimR family lysis-lysogeny pheromone receptor n=1 Tax=Bacillus sp. JJ1127 TaxID=3122952 RepID=UPI002FFE0FCD